MLIIAIKFFYFISISNIYQNKLLYVKLDAKYNTSQNQTKIPRLGKKILQKYKYFTNSNGKTLYNSRYFRIEKNVNFKLIYYRSQNLKPITNFYISS